MNIDELSSPFFDFLKPVFSWTFLLRYDIKVIKLVIGEVLLARLSGGCIGTVAASIVLLLLSAQAGQESNHVSTPQRVVVTFEGKTNPLASLAPDDFEIQAGKQKLKPDRIYLPGEFPSYFVIVIQENLIPHFEQHVPAMRDFIQSLPQGTAATIVYLSKETPVQPVRFYRDQQVLVGLLRTTNEKTTNEEKSEVEQVGSPYMNLAEFLARFQLLPPAKVSVLFVSSGIDISYKVPNPRLQLAIERAKAVVSTIWTIHIAEPGRTGKVETITVTEVVRVGNGPPGGLVGLRGSLGTRPGFRTAKDFLAELSEMTGGKFLASEPKNLAPVLDKLAQLLDRQVVLEFTTAEPLKKIIFPLAKV